MQFHGNKILTHREKNIYRHIRQRILRITLIKIKMCLLLIQLGKIFQIKLRVLKRNLKRTLTSNIETKQSIISTV